MFLRFIVKSNAPIRFIFFFFSSRRRHTRSKRDWSSDVCSSDLAFHGRKRSEDFVHFLDLSGSLSDVSNRAACVAEKAKIKQVLDLSNWNKTQAAEMLSVSYKTLLNKVKEYELE